MDYKKLVEQLNRKGLSNGSSIGHHSGLYEIAASAITELLARAEIAEKELREREPVVHCKDCSHQITECWDSKGDDIQYCRLRRCIVRPNDFCSYGEKTNKEV